MFDDVRISVASHKIHSTLKSSPGGRNGFLMVLGRCRRVWRLYDFDVVWILDYFFVHATRHSPAWHLTTPYLLMSFHNQPQYPFETLCRSMASSSGIQPRESTDREDKKCARAGCSRNPSASGGQWLSMIGICCDIDLVWSYDRLHGEHSNVIHVLADHSPNLLYRISTCHHRFVPGGVCTWAMGSAGVAVVSPCFTKQFYTKWFSWSPVQRLFVTHVNHVSPKCWSRCNLDWINLGLSGMAGTAKRDTYDIGLGMITPDLCTL